MHVLLFPILVLVAALTVGACATTDAVPRPYPGTTPRPTSTADAGGVPASSSPPPAKPEAAAAEAAVETAEGLLGTPYRSGGTDPGGFDCSGFVQYVFARAGVALPRSVRELWRVGEPVGEGEVMRGDLVFFAIGGTEVSHVGIALDSETFVHAPSSRGVVRVERVGTEYWARRYAGARRVVTLPAFPCACH